MLGCVHIFHYNLIMAWLFIHQFIHQCPTELSNIYRMGHVVGSGTWEAGIGHDEPYLPSSGEGAWHIGRIMPEEALTQHHFQEQGALPFLSNSSSVGCLCLDFSNLEN